MWHQFTAAAERALICASGWTNGAGCNELEAEPLLVGLLGEPECRAAAMLARLAVDIPAVCRRWPGLVEAKPPSREGAARKPFSQEVELSFELARQRLAVLLSRWNQPNTSLGLRRRHEASAWLRARA